MKALFEYFKDDLEAVDSSDTRSAVELTEFQEDAVKKAILLTATPINDDLFDLYHQFNFIFQGDRSYFAAAGIGDVYKFFLHARRESRNGSDD